MNTIIQGISPQERIKGCSDKTAEALLTFLLELPDKAWENAEIYENLRGLLIDNFKYVPIIHEKPDYKKAHMTDLPNGIYRKLLVHTIIRLPTLTPKEINQVQKIFTHLEEQAITGFSYISIHGKAFAPIKSILETFGTDYEIINYTDHLNNNKLNRGIPIHNTLVVFLAQKLLI